MGKLILAICAATFLTSAAAVSATASPLIPQPRFEVNDQVLQVRSRKLRRPHHSHRRHYSQKRRYSHERRYSHKRRYSYKRRYPSRRSYYSFSWGWPGPYIYVPRYYYRPYNNAHLQWCYRRYRSYRASDNTFQPYHGPRRKCISPYGP